MIKKIFRIKRIRFFKNLPNVPMKYCSMSIEKTLLMDRASLPKDQKRYDSASQIFE